MCLGVICEKQTAGGHVLTQNQHDHEGLCDSVHEPKGWGGGGRGPACICMYVCIYISPLSSTYDPGDVDF